MKKNIALLCILLLVLNILTISQATAYQITPSLSAVAQPQGNYVALNWGVNDSSQAYNYMVYKKDSSGSFQSIPVKNNLNVLEVYPYIETLGTWMSSYGLGKINVTSTTIENFNVNPGQAWNYDVVVFGFADSNNGKDLSTSARDVVAQYIQAGRGVLFGHDTLRYAALPNFASLAPYLNMYLPSDTSSVPWYTGSYNDNGVTKSQIQIVKKGLLTNYPWQIGSVGQNLIVPQAHTVCQIANGDIWLKFVDSQDPAMNKNSNFFLTTWNNVAMVQTGHSIRADVPVAQQATPDEQKLLANTIFYLGQITNGTSWDDHSAQDLAAPNAISDLKYTENGRNVTVNFTAPSDNGSQYQYFVRATGQSDHQYYDSSIINSIITTGIKGYSYVIDQNPSTIPDDTVDTTSTTINQTLAAGTYYLHIKAIDNAGNASAVSHLQIVVPPIAVSLNATPSPTGDHVSLNWSVNDTSQGYSYMIYSKDKNAADFQTIPAKATVKVLNIYPYVSDTITFTNWKGQTFTLPKSASVKEWMETPNADDPKGYGKGLIDVDSVNIDDFNANPLAYLKDSNGNYKYDAVFEGAWDCNNLKDLTPASAAAVADFIKSGRGYLGGHDTFWDYSVNRDTLRNFLNLKLGYNIDYPSIPWVGDSSLKIVKKGLLTSYPWNIGDIGSVLNVPYSHTTGQYAFGDVWMQYNNTANEQTSPNGQGTNNFYLTTWGNTAMIQTGHSNGAATPDEQKVLANTLFYLSQITNQTSWDDHLAQDLTAPDAVSGINSVRKGVSVTFNYAAPKDNGNTYQYYVRASGLNTADQENSPVVEATVVSGIKGYSYVIDQNPNTIPDDTVDTTSTSITQTLGEGTYYLHIKAIDNMGNASTVNHYQIVVPQINPAITATPNPSNNSIDLNWNVSDTSQNYRYTLYKKLSTDNSYQAADMNGATSYTDNAGNDTMPPSQVSNITPEVVEQHVDINFTPATDIGNTYNYYIQATGETGNTQNSAVISSTIITGIKGYSYVIDKVPDTIPDNVIDTTNTTVSADFEVGGTYYIHIRAIDNAGNASTTTTTSFFVEEPLKIYGMEMTGHVNAPLGLMLPVSYPVSTPTEVKAGYEITMTVDHRGADSIDFNLFANGQPLTVHTNSGDTSVLTSQTVRTEETTTFVFWFDKDLPQNTVIDAKIVLKKTLNDGTQSTLVNNVLGDQFAKVIGSAKQDSNINLTQ